jgi:hypothetical protein
LHDQVIQRIEFEIAQIDRLLNTYQKLLQEAQDAEPDLVALTALASVLHSFYTGVENIFTTVAKEIDQQLPDGSRSHSDLLLQMTSSTVNRNSVVDIEMAKQLATYLGFRHFYRHSYSFLLDWAKQGDLVLELPDLWKDLRTDLERFLEELKKRS